MPTSLEPAKQIATFQHNAESIAFHPDGRVIAAAIRYHEVRLVGIGGESLAAMPSEARGESLEFLRDGSGLLITNRLPRGGTDMGVAQVWNSDLSEKRSDLWCRSRGKTEGITIARQFDDQRTLAVGCGYDRRAHVLDTDSQVVVASTQAGRDRLTALATRTGYVASGYADGTIAEQAVRNHDAEQASTTRPCLVYAHRGGVTSLAFVPGDRLVSAGADGSVRMWPKLGEPTRPLRFTGEFPKYAAIAPLGDVAALVLGTEVVFVSDRGTIAGRHAFEGEPLCMAWSPDGTRLAIGLDAPPRIAIVDTAGRELSAIATHDAPTALVFDASGSILVAGVGTELVEFDSRSGNTRRITRCDGAVMCLAMDDRFVVAGGVWPSLLITPRGGVGSPSHICCDSHTSVLTISPDGSQLASAHVDSVVRLWDLDTRQLKSELRGHGGSRFVLSYSQDAESLFTACADGVLRVWDVYEGRLFGTVSLVQEGTRSPAIQEPVNCLVASSQGKLLVAESRDTHEYTLTWMRLD